MFSWNAPKTYYKELTTARLERSLDDRLDSTLFRTDAPAVVRTFTASLYGSDRLPRSLLQRLWQLSSTAGP